MNQSPAKYHKAKEETPNAKPALDIIFPECPSQSHEQRDQKPGASTKKEDKIVYTLNKSQSPADRCSFLDAR